MGVALSKYTVLKQEASMLGPNAQFSICVFNIVLFIATMATTALKADGEARGGLTGPAITQAQLAAGAAGERIKYYQRKIKEYEDQIDKFRKQIRELEAKKAAEKVKNPRGDTSKLDTEIEQFKQKIAEAEKALNEADPNHGKEIGNGLGKDKGENKGLNDKLCEAMAQQHETREAAKQLEEQHKRVNDAQTTADRAAQAAQVAQDKYRDASSDQMIPGNKDVEGPLNEMEAANMESARATRSLQEEQAKLADLTQPWESRESTPVTENTSGSTNPSLSSPESQANGLRAAVEGRATPGPAMQEGFDKAAKLANDPQGTKPITGKTPDRWRANEGEARVNGEMKNGRYFVDKRSGERFFVPNDAYDGKGLDGYMARGAKDLSGLYKLQGKMALGNVEKLPDGSIRFNSWYHDGREHYSSVVWKPNGNQASISRVPSTNVQMRQLTNYSGSRTSVRSEFAGLDTSLPQPTATKFNPLVSSTWSWNNFFNLFK
ncbi:hypothetical protein EBQ74_09525 [bacterium]|nr:hypothetical protein [bacterium]